MATVKRYSLIIVTVLLYILYLPLISKVNFLQNDDWNRTTSVERFLQGDFSLLPVTATTFYTQGIMGTAFSAIFGVSKLPFLTLLISVLNFYIFSLILNKFFSFGKVTSALLGLTLFFNPLHMYSSIGFMTENYTLLFVFISLFFFLCYEKSEKRKYLLISNLFIVLGFFCKQNAIVFLLSTLIYFLYKRKFKPALFQFITTVSLLLFYIFIFPTTPEMSDKGLNFEHFRNFGYSYSLVFGMLVVSLSFILNVATQPIINSFIGVISRQKSKYLYLLVFAVISVLLYLLLNHFFQPGKISWEEYPYFENTFERTGFLPRTVQGTKYFFRGNYDLYKYWNLMASTVLPLIISSLVIFRKKIINIYSIYISGYLLLMVFTAVFFDRYILLLIPFIILFLIKTFDIKDTKSFRLITGLYVAFLSFFSTQLATDFILSHNYIWSRSKELVNSGIKPSDIYATGAWKKVYGLSPNYRYIFTYDSPYKNPELLSNFTLFEENPVQFKRTIFIDPAVYLYARTVIN